MTEDLRSRYSAGSETHAERAWYSAGSEIRAERGAGSETRAERGVDQKRSPPPRPPEG